MAKIGGSLRAIWAFVLVLFVVICFGASGAESQARRIPDDEMKALGEIAKQLGMKDWNLTQNYCVDNLNWYTPIVQDKIYNSTVNCNCPSDNECHISTLFLKGYDLPGVLPPSLVKLPYLKSINFSRNYLSGTLPREWVSIKFETMDLSTNRLSGPIPKYLGGISTLTLLSLEGNMFSGTVPAELGNMVNLTDLNLSANNLTGMLPNELGALRNLTWLRLSSNNFTGKLIIFPSWNKLLKLELEATGFEGPIPTNISLISTLTDIRITDLNGGTSTFPNLEKLTVLEKLVLRSCNLNGSIPDYLGKFPLRLLDLSYNRLEGTIPNIGQVESLSFMFLTRNLLTGYIPDWMKNRPEDLYAIDLSYNNFTESPDSLTCNKKNLNLFRSFSTGSNFYLGDCFKSACPKRDRYSLYINCGGIKAAIGNTTFEADDDQGGMVKFDRVGTYWGFSSTGYFRKDDLLSANDYIANVSSLNISYYLLLEINGTGGYGTAKNVSVPETNYSQLFRTARLSPLSLTYYGRCLANGNYTVSLHFAEIIFRDNRSFQSLGRRIFDVYIQDELVLKDFDIENFAQGVDKVVVLKFSNIAVRSKFIEIRFYWAGKGTRNTPKPGIYGPLISAISIESHSKPPSYQTRRVPIIIGVVALALCLIFVILFFFWRKRHLQSSISREQELRGLDLQTGLFTFRQIKAATNNFDDNNKIGEGGFGSVYKGILLDGSIIAVKQLSSQSKQGNREFVNEIGMISGLQHPNVVRLYGCCVEGNQLLLVYEYMENNSLARALFGPEECQLKLDWPTRFRICIDIARGLAFLQEESRLKIVHRDIKASNVLLDKDLNAKISDFGLAKLAEDDNTHISTRVAGTIGYMAPEYALWGYLTHKADVYSFGVVALEIVAGKNNMKYRPSENYVCLLDWALVLQQKRCLKELVDSKLGSNFNKEEALRMIKVALLCTNPSPALRPTMSTVVSMLEGHLMVQELMADPSLYNDDFRFKALRDKYDELQSQKPCEAQPLIDCTGTTQTGSSSTSAQDLYPTGSSFTSTQDLYPINPDTQ